MFRRWSDGREEDSSTLPVLRQFVAALFAASPRRTVESLILTVVAGLFEGVGLLLLIPLLQLIGLNTAQGSLGRFFRRCGRPLPSSGSSRYCRRCWRSMLASSRCKARCCAGRPSSTPELREDLVYALRDRAYRAVVGSTWVYFSRRRISAFLQILTEKIDYVSAAASSLISLVVAIGLSMAYVVMALRVSVPMTLFVLCRAGCWHWVSGVV